MRKLILTLTALLGIAPAALAASGPGVAPAPLVGGEEFAAPPAPQLRDEAQSKLRTAERRADDRAHTRTRARRAEAAASHAPPHLQAIAQCESGGDPSAIGGGGQFRGKYQFTHETWAAVGGSGDPASAPEAEQDRRATQLYESSGPGQWPVCGQ